MAERLVFETNGRVPAQSLANSLGVLADCALLNGGWRAVSITMRSSRTIGFRDRAEGRLSSPPIELVRPVRFERTLPTV